MADDPEDLVPTELSLGLAPDRERFVEENSPFDAFVTT
jgi:hypothetical protein